MKTAVRTAVGAGFGAGATKIAGALPVYEQKLPPVQGRNPDQKHRQLIIYEPPGGQQDAVKELPKISSGIAGTLGGLTGLAYDANKRMEEDTTGLHRKFVQALALLTGVVAHSLGRVDGAIKSEQAEYEALVEDLNRAGYEVKKTSEIGQFQKTLAAACRQRTNNSRTIIIVKAHGGTSTETGSYIDGGNQKDLPVSSLAKLVSAIPGHSLLLSSTCKFSLTDFQKAHQLAHISVFSQGGGKGKNAGMDVPFYSALRQGIRNNDGVISATQTALSKQMEKQPWAVRARQRHAGRDIPTFSGKPEFTL